MKEALDLALPAVTGAALALCVLLALRPWKRAATREKGGDRGEDWVREAEGIEKGLRELAEEVESRLDAKLDRLDLLLAQVRRVLRDAGGGLDAELDLDSPRLSTREASSRSLGADEPASPLGPVSDGERARVLALAAGGKPSDAIAEEVGLRRGEVDLILRLHRTAERPGE